MSADAVGVDGWKKGWVAARADGRRIEWQGFSTFAEVLVAFPSAVVAVDIPIGISDEPRACDRAARRFLAGQGAVTSTVFDAPTAAAVAAWESKRTHADAMGQRGSLRGVSIQAWNLIEKIVDVRDAITAAPDQHVVEAHPECSFRRLDRRIGRVPKKTASGVGLRLRALAAPFDIDLTTAPADVPVDDVLDAAVLAWTARCVAAADPDLLVLPAGAESGPRIVV